ncbi:hypothetical protein CYL20_04790 [Pseudomonas palleroniana]|uniref:Uncharacterized protein n=1 Tax=Pseudomonas palleroniana TaxID=191390 RepID=A0A2L1J5Z9_9PSED|nr:hypothetical protein [Pseudomonas palleroniana]AVE03888.1 hypothetical protein CYL20_04790 [Pseudomonas palleroniana]
MSRESGAIHVLYQGQYPPTVRNLGVGQLLDRDLENIQQMLASELLQNSFGLRAWIGKIAYGARIAQGKNPAEIIRMDIPNFLPMGKTTIQPDGKALIVKTADGHAAAG